MIRSTNSTVTFARSFLLSGIADAQPAGTYTVETNEEQLQTSFPAYQRVSTILRLPGRSGGTVLERAVDVDPAELAALLAKDAASEAAAAVTSHDKIVPAEATGRPR